MVTAAPTAVAANTATLTEPSIHKIPQPAAVNGLPTEAHSTRSSTIYTNYPSHIPFSQRRAPALDLSTVERRGYPTAARETRRVRPHGLQDAPTFRPSEEDFKDPFAYIESIRQEAEKYGICKIIPPDSWSPDFAINTERFFFKTRKQELNSVEGGTRQNIQYLDQLAKFHKQHGMNLNRFPSVDKRPLDLYKLKKAVECRGGFEKVCKLKKWAEIGRDLGYSGKIMSSLSTSLKNSYQKWLHPYEEYLKVAKPGVHQQLEYENGGPHTPSSAKHLQGSQQATPNHIPQQSPVIQASNALNQSLAKSSDLQEKQPTSHAVPHSGPKGFTAVNANGFTPVNGFQSSQSQSIVKAEPKPNGESAIHQSSQRPATNGHVPPSAAGEGSFVSHFMSSDNPNPLKRTWSEEISTVAGREDTLNFASNVVDERRSKRAKKAPTVAGSHMSQPRPANADLPSSQRTGKKGEVCEYCDTKDDRSAFLVCYDCDCGYHKSCLPTPTKVNPLVDWHCPKCLVGSGEYGFEEGGVYSLKQFQEKARLFKETYFDPKMQFDPVTNKKRAVTEDDVEREFWRLVESPGEEVEVEYGADIHSTTHGSAFPSMEKDPENRYSTDYWNLNIMPYHPDSLFKHISSDISGMTIPWLYVGMCFSTFCWHNEDHYCYSANYQHFGATKTWYGIPGADAERFEQAMKEEVPELFESQPDLLFQLVTLLPPDRLKKAGVNVYALDQRAGQFVITFPQAYHAGFNHGFNFNEAVNFAPADWEGFGDSSIRRLQDFRKPPCFSHDELLMAAAKRDNSIKTAKWLAPALQRAVNRELQQRGDFLERHKATFASHRCKVDQSGPPGETCPIGIEVQDVEVPESEYQCTFCKAYSYLSSYHCHSSSKVLCMLHAGNFECCEASDEQRYKGEGHSLRFRMRNEGLDALVQKVTDRANQPDAWQDRLSKLLDGEERPALKNLQTLVNEGEKIPWDLPGLEDLKAFVAKCNEWVEDAQNYITRKQQNRRKNEKAWRKSKAKADEMEEKEKDVRKVDNILRLLAQAEELCFDCPQIMTLKERAEAIAEFRKNANAALIDPNARTMEELEELAEAGKGFNVDVPEVEQIETLVKQQRWTNDVSDHLRVGGPQFTTLKIIRECIERGLEAGIMAGDRNILRLQELEEAGRAWEEKAQEVMGMESIHHQQLEAMAGQAERLPISEEMRSKIDGILSRQREAQKITESICKKSQEADFRRRPKYKEGRDAADSLSGLASKPSGVTDLENALKRQENWMRKGKKLFGKANAPLHILKQHLEYVAEHNSYCYDLSDKPRNPVEPASRENSPVEGEESEGLKSEKNVFCMCRQPEAGTMLECDLCLEWYHSKCLKIARGKVKEDDKYNCPICDYRVKIPRDAARPKLEDLNAWQDEIYDLPFQPEEEDILQEIIRTAQAFRDFLRPLVNPVMTNPGEVTTQRFYLRKIEGAEILLASETNFFRQEVHRWAPVADEPPKYIDASNSTRKPRPTKQQKLMKEHGVSTPEELPLQFRTKSYNPAKRKESDSKIQPAGGRRPMSSHSVSTENSSHIPPPISTGHQDPMYASHYPMPGHPNPHQPSESPRFPPSPYYQNGTNTHSPFSHHQSPLSATHPPIEPSLFQTGEEDHFEHPHAGLGATPPPDSDFAENDTSPQGDAAVDRMFDEFVSHPEDDMPQHSEAADALEDRSREFQADASEGVRQDS